MKKKDVLYIRIAIAELLLLSLAACSASPETPAPSPTASTSTTATATETEAPTATAATMTTTTTTATATTTTTALPTDSSAVTGPTLAPGTPPDVSTIPTADQSETGEVHTLTFHGENARYPTLLYIYDPADGYERLVFMPNPPPMERYAEWRVYETDLGGVAGLCRGLQTGIRSRLDRKVNISYQEAKYFQGAAGYPSGTVYDPAELIDITAPLLHIPQGRQTVLVHTTGREDEEGTQPLGDGYYCVAKINGAVQNSEELTDDLRVIDRIVERFALDALLRWEKQDP